MKTYTIRLKKGDDLKESLQIFSKEKDIKAGYIATCVGSLDQLRIRKADGVSVFYEINNFEIISLSGTLAENGMHLHIGVSDVNLECFGGHLLEGCLINTTAEIVIVELDDHFIRVDDEDTGYKELEVL